MLNFEVERTERGFWAVSSKGVTLHLSSSEDEALKAALLLASGARRSGEQASIIISPVSEDSVGEEGRLS